MAGNTTRLCSQPLYESHPTHKPPKTRAHTTRLLGGGEWIHQTCGGHSIGETPGNIPNPEAKPNNADGTAPDRVWESRKPPQPHHKKGWGVEQRKPRNTHQCSPSNAPPPTPLSHTPMSASGAPDTPTHNRGANPDYYCKDAQPHPTHTEHNASKKTQNTAPARRTQMLLMARNCQLHKQRWRNPFDIRLQIIIPLRQANAH